MRSRIFRACGRARSERFRVCGRSCAMAAREPNTKASALQRAVEAHRQDLLASVGELQGAVRSQLDAKTVFRRVMTRGRERSRGLFRRARARPGRTAAIAVAALTVVALLRSEERRVGKGCRARRSSGR